MISLSYGEKRLDELLAKQKTGSSMSEAQTRFHIIDKILFDCLGWDKEREVEVEKHEDRKFTDYELGKPRLAIVEAKREGRVFNLPAGINSNKITDLRSITKVSLEAKEAIEQAQNYCSSRGVPLAIVTNGHQYVIFLASRQDGVSVLEGNAVVFNGLGDFKSNFTLA
ncbi:hypothetical protein [Microbulbifer sp. PAAF003]|uniref:hypothetical protein n=1 Tax=Microbulbifer sp. PAAF003 TaxID=3243375 RepID=UPI0040395E9F